MPCRINYVAGIVDDIGLGCDPGYDIGHGHDKADDNDNGGCQPIIVGRGTSLAWRAPTGA